jgi:hypothetical protein
MTAKIILTPALGKKLVIKHLDFDTAKKASEAFRDNAYTDGVMHIVNNYGEITAFRISAFDVLVVQP